MKNEFDHLCSDILYFKDFILKKNGDKDVFLGFPSDFKFDGNYRFALFSVFGRVKAKNVFAGTDKERATLKEMYNFLGENFSSANLQKLPIYFSANDGRNIWKIYKYGEYYICPDLATDFWAKFGICNSNAIMDFWIQQKVDTYKSLKDKYIQEMEKSRDRIRDLRDNHIPKLKTVIENFSIAKNKIK